ncbi:hypothetical protein [Antrihabitans sp. YC2-6]|uniref:hypothetical protein n=1 Tax=Antrihabitans sp. YC2-6 TaxID=2799498 RepID=UPI0018F70FC2|nr:hypothetical protein [Antrihabitans sp. YC2-6]MBJ8348088.1 hypothetical protein [Antrihabitans sp. YC2-6]
MDVDHKNVRDLIAAMFSYEFIDGGVDYDSIEQIHRGDIGEWLEALDRSGLFDEATIDAVGDRWRQRPKDLLEVLLADADEMTRRRCSVTWSVLDRFAPLADIS